MKRTFFSHLMLVAFVGSLVFAGCKKDETIAPAGNGSLRLTAEKLSGEGKTYVDQLTVGWVSGDNVRINGEELTVGENGAITGTPENVNMIAFHPATLNTTASAASTTPSSVEVELPSVYEYEYTTSGGYQKLDMPMVGIASANPTELPMKHICSAMQVTVKNNFTEGLVLDSIILRNADQMLSGTVTINNLTEAPTVTVSTGGRHSVQLNFTETTTIGAGSSLTVQIPVLPTSGTTYVSVRGHLATSGTAYRYKRSTSISMSRAQVHRAPIAMAANGSYMEQLPPAGAVNGVFSVSANKQVYFSKGNLQYNKTTQEWSFMEHQYTTVETQSQNVGDDYASQNIVSLFGWGTWTGSNNPIRTDNSDATTYTWDNNDFQRTITSATGTWYTLESSEWVYLLDNRSGARYAKAIVHGVSGLIIFPDNSVTVSGNSATFEGVDFNNVNDYQGSYNTISDGNWTTLEAAGCVFLPAAGYRYDTGVNDVGVNGYYWSSTPLDDNRARNMYFYGFYLAADGNSVRCYGRSVRLVQDKTN